MVVIFSNNALEIKGLYIAPRFFNEHLTLSEKVDLVYTDDDKIKSFYESKQIEVKPITENVETQKATKRKTKD